MQEAADQAGCSLTTVRRRLADDDFRRAVDDARGELIDRAVGNLSNLSYEASDILADLARQARSEHVRYLAARALIELGKALRETQVIERRLAEVEAQLAADKNADKNAATGSNPAVQVW